MAVEPRGAKVTPNVVANRRGRTRLSTALGARWPVASSGSNVLHVAELKTEPTTASVDSCVWRGPARAVGLRLCSRLVAHSRGSIGDTLIARKPAKVLLISGSIG